MNNLSEQLETLSGKLQAGDFDREYTLDLSTGSIELSDELSIDELIYADSIGGGKWSLDYSHSLMPELTTVTDTLFAPYNYMSLGTMRSHLPGLEEVAKHSKLVATLAIVDVRECGECPDYERCEEDHILGWALITALIV